ncbi:hypothetical protein D3C77_311720 [compost metagenome]
MALLEGFRSAFNLDIAPGQQAGVVGGHDVAARHTDILAGTHHHRVTADRRAHLGDGLAAVDAGLLGARQTGAAGLGLAVIAVVAVLRGDQVHIAAGVEVGLVARSHAAGAQGKVVTRLQGHIAASHHRGGHLLDMVLLAGDFLRLARRVLLVGSGHQVQVPRRGHRHIALGLDCTGNGGDIAPGVDGQVTPDLQA